MKKDQLESRIRFHHVGILVRNITEGIAKYASTLGLDKDKITVEVINHMTGKDEVEELKYAFLPLAEGENNFIEIVEPITSGPTARYLEKHEEGLLHLAFESSKKPLKTLKRREFHLLEQHRSKMFFLFFYIQNLHTAF